MLIEVAPIYGDLWTTNRNFVILAGGRDSGKTTVARDYAMTKNEELTNRDIIVCRDSYSELADSLYTTLCKYISKHKLWNYYDNKQNPLRIINKRNGNIVYFTGIGGSDKDRTKGLETEHPVEVVIFDELQQVKEQENYEQAIASFRRLLTPTSKVIHLFNPPRQKAHWLNVWAKLKETDPDYLVIRSSWLDMIHYLNDLDIKEILKMEALNKDEYDWLYMGKTVGGLGSVYPQFKPEKHLITLEQARKKFAGHKIISVIIGGDNAVSRDATCLCPIAIFDNGQCCVLDLFYHDPKVSGDMSISELIPYMQRWLGELERKYNLSDRAMLVPIAFIIDGATIGKELVRQLRFVLNPDRYDIIEYNDKNILQMASNLKSVFSRNMLYIIDYGGHYNYVLNRFEKRYNVLAEQIESLIWNEKETGFDPIVPNDACDALTYGANAIFKNPFNLYYIQKAIQVRKEFYDIEDLLPQGGNL